MTANFTQINMTADELNAALADDAVVLIDVREPHEFAEERIEGALNYPLSTFDPLALPPVEAGKYMVMQCAGGVRSVRALEAAHAAGLDVSHHLAGGIKAWKADGFPTE